MSQFQRLLVSLSFALASVAQAEPAHSIGNSPERADKNVGVTQLVIGNSPTGPDKNVGVTQLAIGNSPTGPDKNVGVTQLAIGNSPTGPDKNVGVTQLAIGNSPTGADKNVGVTQLAIGNSRAGMSPVQPRFWAGAAAIDISPTVLPVRVNAMFTERSGTNVTDTLHAKALALDDGLTKMVLCVVDSCMLPRDLIDRAKAQASQATRVPVQHMLVSSTHTHSAPSAMGCLGSRVDPQYSAWLPGRIAAAITRAVQELAPARVGWAQTEDWEHTFNRRWIRRPDRMLTDPFGERNVRAHMHPGYESTDAVGPSGPVDPQLSVLALQRADGRPLALLANYSMHYYGSPLLSSDYFGRFAQHIAGLLGGDARFVGIMSQGTSGDLMWMDYGAPSRDIGYDAYAKAIAERVAGLVQKVQWHDSAPLKIVQRVLEIAYRVPDETRLTWARQIAAQLGDKLPQTLPEIYALEAICLHERPRTEVQLQALRIGDLAIAALPNEVFALTGLKIKRRSPFPATFNIELANGAEGYIPPPEQHQLGGYTTWPARTAGLATDAEPRLVQTTLELLEQVTGRPLRQSLPEHGAYAQSVLQTRPLAYWRLEEMAPPLAQNAVGPQYAANWEGDVAFFLPGADGRVGYQPAQPPSPNAFSGTEINHAVHLAGGRLRSRLPVGDRYTVELWLWNGLPSDARPVTGYLFWRVGSDDLAPAERLGIGGTAGENLSDKLILNNGSAQQDLLVGRTGLTVREWHYVVLVREGGRVRVYLDGQADPEIAGDFKAAVPAGEHTLYFGGSNDRSFNFEGKLDEIAVYPRPLTPTEIRAHYHASGLSR